MNVIGDTLFGTRFNLSDGSVRGPWCPGGTAGPLLRIARRLPAPLLLLLRNQRIQQPVAPPVPFLRRALLVARGDADKDSGKEVTRPLPDLTATAALEVLPVTENADGSLAVTLPPPPPSARRIAVTAVGAGAGAASEFMSKREAVEGGDVEVVERDSTQKKKRQLSWVADCDLAGYEH